MFTVVLVSALLGVVPAFATDPQQSKASAPRESFDSFRIPAGTGLLLKLRTSLDSGSMNVDDQVEATFWSPVIQDEVELIPVDSVMSGKVTAVVRASKETPAGSVTFTLSVVRHAGTGDRAMLPTQRIVIQAPIAPSEGGRRSRKVKPAEAKMAEGATFVAVTSQPLIVQIPK
jgi:hypothetical protein